MIINYGHLLKFSQIKQVEYNVSILLLCFFFINISCYQDKWQF